MDSVVALRSIRYDLLDYIQILNDRELMALYREDRKMLLNMALKRIVDFHGHLCPDLVIGAKVCQHARALVGDEPHTLALAAVVAENCTSALDAIQVLFDITPMPPTRISTEVPTVLATCALCGQPVLRHRGVECEGEIRCLSCFQSARQGRKARYLH